MKSTGNMNCNATSQKQLESHSHELGAILAMPHSAVGPYINGSFGGRAHFTTRTGAVKLTRPAKVLRASRKKSISSAISRCGGRGRFRVVVSHLFLSRCRILFPLRRFPSFLRRAIHMVLGGSSRQVAVAGDQRSSAPAMSTRRATHTTPCVLSSTRHSWCKTTPAPPLPRRREECVGVLPQVGDPSLVLNSSPLHGTAEAAHRKRRSGR